MSRQSVEIVRAAYERFVATGQLDDELSTPDFVWDMSHFHGWPDRQVYEGVDGARAFLNEWSAAWDDWTIDLEALRDAGEKVVARVRQRGRSKAAGTPVDMVFAQVWTLRDGKQARMDMYSDPDEALTATGLEA